MRFLMLLLILNSTNAFAFCYPKIKGTVTWVTDGDTITFKPENKNKTLKIRLSDIDAPETSHFGSESQPFGEESKDLLSKLILNKEVILSPHSKDIYGRILATIEYINSSGKKINVNKYMVKKGMAWHYSFFSLDKKIKSVEKNAKSNGIGLWIDAKPIAPWEWRKDN